MNMRFANHREFSEWQAENDVSMFMSDYGVWPNNHTEFVGVDRFGQCYRIEHYGPAEYFVYPISEEEATASLIFSWRKNVFKALLKERKEIASVLSTG